MTRYIKPVIGEGKVTIPKKLRIKYGISDYVEFIDTDTGITIKKF